MRLALKAQRLAVIRLWLMPNWSMEGMACMLRKDPRPTNGEPGQRYHSNFAPWYQLAGEEDAWREARKLRPRQDMKMSGQDFIVTNGFVRTVFPGCADRTLRT